MLSAAGTEAGQGAAPAAPGAQGELTEVHGWGRTAPARCQITALPTGAGSAPAAAAAIRACGPRGVLGRWLRRIRLIDGLGAAHELAPDGPDPDAFWATVGGMGLTGVITEATVAVPPTPSSWLQVSNTRAPNLDTLLSELDAAAHSHQHAVAWVDALATGRGSGRGIISAADPTDPGQPADPDRWGYHPADRPDLVPPIPLTLVRRASVRAFNAAWWRLPANRAPAMVAASGFYHPLDALPGWNRFYGPRGFVQYHFVVPLGAEAVLHRVLELLRGAAAVAPFLGVLKRFGPAGGGMLSFPLPGWSMALDLACGPAAHGRFRSDLGARLGLTARA